MGINDWLFRRMIGNAMTKWLQSYMDKDGRSKSSVKLDDIQMERDSNNRIHVKIQLEIIADEKNVMDVIDKITKTEDEK